MAATVRACRLLLLLGGVSAFISSSRTRNHVAVMRALPPSDRRRGPPLSPSVALAAQVRTRRLARPCFRPGRILAAVRNIRWIALACALLTLFSTSLGDVATPPSALAAPLPSTVETRLVSSTAAVETVRSVEDVPDPRRERGVTDLAGMISENARAQIECVAARARDETGSSLVVVTVDRIAGVGSPKQFATALFNHWRLGPAGKNNGVLVLVVRDARRVEVEIGSGLNEAFNRGQWLERMIDERIISEFKRARFDDGLEAGVTCLADKLRGVDVKLASRLPVHLIVGGLVGGFGLAMAQQEWASRPRCHACSARPLELGPFQWTENATHLKAERTYTCKKCGHTGTFVKEIPRYDGVRRRPDGTTYYYRLPPPGSGGDSGGSSSGGGAGGSW